MIKWAAIRQIAVYRLLEFRREPTALFWVFGFPTALLIVLGLAFTERPPETLNVDVLSNVDALGKGSVELERLLKRLSDDERLIIHQLTDSASEDSITRLRQVGTSLVVQTQRNENEALRSTFLLTFDPDRPDSSHARAIVEMHIAKLGDNTPTVQVIESRSFGDRYIDFLVPGLLAVNAMGASLIWFGYGLTELRMLHLLRVLLATPLSRFELLFGLLSARWILLIPETLLVLLIARILFTVDVTGSLLSLFCVQWLGATMFASIGLLIGSRGRKLEAASGWVSVLMLTQWVLCGVFFSREVLPVSWQPIADLLPLSCYVDATRGIMQTGVSLLDLGRPLLGMTGWTTTCGLAGLWIFRADDR